MEAPAPSQYAGIPRDALLVKMENESIMAMAMKHPRQLALVRDTVFEQLEMFPDLAAEAIYQKPVGKDQNGDMKYARGLSVRMAETLAEAYGFNRVRTSIDPVDGDPDTVRVSATFTDYCNGRVWESSKLLSKFYRARGGGMRRHDDDRFYNVVCAAESSKCVREAILRCIPAGLKQAIEEKAEEIIEGRLDEATQLRIVGTFANRGVTQAMLEANLRKPMASWNKSDRARLLGLYNAIKDGETTVEEAFGASAQGGEPAGKDPRAAVTQALQQKQAAAGGKKPDPAPAPEAVPTADAPPVAEPTAPPEAAPAPAEETEAPPSEAEPPAFCPISDLKNIADGAIVSTQGRVKTAKPSLGGKDKQTPIVDAMLYDGPYEVRVSAWGSMPEWLVQGSEVYVRALERKGKFFNVLEWEPVIA